MDISLRRTTIEDVPHYLRHMNNPSVVFRLLHPPFPFQEKDARRFIQEIAQKETTEVWVIEVGKEFAGVIGLHDIVKDHKAALGYWLAPEFWGKGIMKAAIEMVEVMAKKEHGIMRMESSAFQGNTASARLLEKCGFQQEGCARRAVKKHGRTLDLILYGKLYD